MFKVVCFHQVFWIFLKYFKDYRFSFNGKENDNEVKGDGNQQDYGMRIYDNRTGKFLSVDPLTKEYPELTPFQFASNNPIENIHPRTMRFLENLRRRFRGDNENNTVYNDNQNVHNHTIQSSIKESINVLLDQVFY